MLVECKFPDVSSSLLAHMDAVAVTRFRILASYPVPVPIIVNIVKIPGRSTGPWEQKEFCKKISPEHCFAYKKPLLSVMRLSDLNSSTTRSLESSRLVTTNRVSLPSTMLLSAIGTSRIRLCSISGL